VKTAEEAVEWQQQKAENVKRVETAKRANQRFRPCFPSAFTLDRYFKCMFLFLTLWKKVKKIDGD